MYYYRIRATNIIGDSAYTTPSASATTPAVTGAVNVYHFDAGSGTTAVDSVGANNGTLSVGANTSAVGCRQDRGWGAVILRRRGEPSDRQRVGGPNHQ